MQVQNLTSLEDLRFIEEESGIPKRAFMATTGDYTYRSTYRFGEANEKGERFVFRDEELLYFSRCRIVKLEPGKEMVLECLDSPNIRRWYTRPVLSVSVA